MNKPLTLTLTALIGCAAAISLMAHEERGEQEAAEHGESSRLYRFLDDDEHHSGAYRGDPGYALYRQECGDGCHIAYPPDLLPGAGWQAVMSKLDDHFGENAELDPETRTQIESFLARTAVTRTDSAKRKGLWQSSGDQTAPRRITDTDYFIGQHHEIPRNMVTENPGIMSFSRCDACHQRAAEGVFAEREIRIPGYGRWDD